MTRKRHPAERLMTKKAKTRANASTVKGNITLPPTIERALSVRQPWANALVHGSKDVENRSRLTRFRGWVWIHASQALAGIPDLDSCARLAGDDFRFPTDADYGAIVGAIEIIDSVTKLRSPWFFGPHGWVVGQRIAFASPVPCSGMLGFWRPSPAVLAACRRGLKRRG
jgi:hypothetical protein